MKISDMVGNALDEIGIGFISLLSRPFSTECAEVRMFDNGKEIPEPKWVSKMYACIELALLVIFLGILLVVTLGAIQKEKPRPQYNPSDIRVTMQINYLPHAVVEYPFSHCENGYFFHTNSFEN